MLRSGKYVDPYSTKVPSSSVFGGSLALDSCPETSRATAVRLLRSLAQPSRHFGPLSSLSLRRGANFHGQGRRSCAEILTRRSFIENVRRDLATETFYRDLVQKAFIGVLWRDLAQRSLTEILLTELLYKLLPRSLQGSCQEASYTDLVQSACQRSLTKILPKELL